MPPRRRPPRKRHQPDQPIRRRKGCGDSPPALAKESVMSATSRIGRRLAVGIGLASAAILLPAVALAAPAAPTAASAAHRALPPRCTAAHTRVWYGEPADDAAGHSYFQLQLSNIGHTTCSFFGFPGVSALNSHGH